MRIIFDDWVKDWFAFKNGNLTGRLEDDKFVDDYYNTKSIKAIPSRFCSYILSHTQRLMNDVIKPIDGFNNNGFYYTDSNFL